MTIIRRVRALVDLDDIADSIGRSSPQAALRFLDAFDQTAVSLASMPGIGSLHESLNPRLQNVRIWPVAGFKKYLIFYRPIEGGIEVLRVLHGARDVDAILGGE